MKLKKTKFDGVYIISPEVFGDARGWFYESYNEKALREAGIKTRFVQDNHSFNSQKNTLRGLHFQNTPHSQAKLVRCTAGAIKDVIVDLRESSPTYKQWLAVELSPENHWQMYIPKGFAHGYLTLAPKSEFQYKVDEFYCRESDRSIRFDDPEIGIDWGCRNPIVSQKDKIAPLLRDSDVNFK